MLRLERRPAAHRPGMTFTRVPPGTRRGGEFANRTRGEGPALDTADLVARAADPDTDPRELGRLSFSKDKDVRLAVAGNPSTPAKDLTRMLNRGWEVRAAVLGNPSLPQETRDRMTAIAEARPARELVGAFDPDPKERLRAAADPATPPEHLVHQVQNQPWVRRTAMANPSLPVDEALRIANQRNAWDAANLLENPTLDPAVIEVLATRPEIQKSKIVTHPNTPSAVLRQVAASDGGAVVVTAALAHRNLTAVDRTAIEALIP